MSEPQKKVVWPWVVGVLIGLPLLYVASFGLGCWQHSRERLSYKHLSCVYRPLINYTFAGPPVVRKVLWAYVDYWDDRNALETAYVREILYDQ